MNCISVSSPENANLLLDRAIEYYDPGLAKHRAGAIWVDLFVNNQETRPGVIHVMHRGSFRARLATADAWLSTKARPAKIDTCSPVLTKRILALHRTFCKLSVDRKHRTVMLVDQIPYDGLRMEEERRYAIWTGGDPQVVVGADPAKHVPFSVWGIAGIPVGRSLLRLRLDAYPETLTQWNSQGTAFSAYGEAILLHKIRHDDLPVYQEADRGDYTREFESFMKGHVVPYRFEYLLVTPDRETLGWRADARGLLISPQYIADEKLRQTTKWFVTDAPYIDDWKVDQGQGIESTRFALDIQLETPRNEKRKAA